MRVILISQESQAHEADFVADIAETLSIKDINDGLRKIQDDFYIRLFTNSSDKESLVERGFTIIGRHDKLFYTVVDSENKYMKPMIRNLKIKKIIQ